MKLWDKIKRAFSSDSLLVDTGWLIRDGDVFLSLENGVSAVAAPLERLMPLIARAKADSVRICLYTEARTGGISVRLVKAGNGVDNLNLQVGHEGDSLYWVGPLREVLRLTPDMQESLSQIKSVFCPLSLVIDIMPTDVSALEA